MPKIYSSADLPGKMSDYGGGVVQPGHLKCDGTAYTKVGVYWDLWWALSDGGVSNPWDTADGQGAPGAGQFRVPICTRKVTVGSGGAGTGTLANTVGSAGGAETHVLTTAELASHDHGPGNLSTGSESADHTHVAGAHTHNILIRTVGGSSNNGGDGTVRNQFNENFDSTTTGASLVHSGVGQTGTFTDAGDVYTPDGNISTGGISASHSHIVNAGFTGSAGADTAHNNIQPTVVVTKQIRY